MHKINESLRVLLNDGWARGHLKTSSGSHCALGAVAEALGFDPTREDDNAYEVLEESLEVKALAQAARELFPNKRYIPSSVATVWRFNDTRSTTLEDVVKVFKRAKCLLDTGAVQ